MERKRLTTLVASIGLVLAVVLSGCVNGSTSTPTLTPSSIATPTSGPNATPTPQVIEVEKKYRALNPQGILQPVETYALSPRLESFDGKTIYVIQADAEANPVIMPVLAEQLPKNFPNTTFVYRHLQSSLVPAPVDDTTLENADAVILGNVDG